MAYTPPTMQGRFTSTGANVNISIPSSYDWIKVYNETQLYAATPNTGAQFYFQRGMTNGRGVLYTKENTIGALVPSQIAANSGFFFLDTSAMSGQLGASIAITNTTNSTTPVISTGTTTGLVAGVSVVRLFNISSGHSVDGQDFLIKAVNAGVSFTLSGVFGTAPFANGAATGNYRKIGRAHV